MFAPVPSSTRMSARMTDALDAVWPSAQSSRTQNRYNAQEEQEKETAEVARKHNNEGTDGNKLSGKEEPRKEEAQEDEPGENIKAAPPHSFFTTEKRQCT